MHSKRIIPTDRGLYEETRGPRGQIKRRRLSTQEEQKYRKAAQQRMRDEAASQSRKKSRLASLMSSQEEIEQAIATVELAIERETAREQIFLNAQTHEEALIAELSKSGPPADPTGDLRKKLEEECRELEKKIADVKIETLPLISEAVTLAKETAMLSNAAEPFDKKVKDSPSFGKLKTENDELRKQVKELRDDLTVATREISKQAQLERHIDRLYQMIENIVNPPPTPLTPQEKRRLNEARAQARRDEIRELDKWLRYVDRNRRSLLMERRGL